MERVTLGRTGIEVAVAGLGCGGPSRLGTATGRSREASVSLVRRALDLGVDLLDTSELYGTEDIVGEAVAGRRDEVVLCTKAYWGVDGRVRTPAELRVALDASLTRLGTDHVDIFLLHAVEPATYGEVRDTLGPALEDLRSAGKIRAAGLSEMFGRDPQHRMLDAALDDDVWDVVMVGYNLLNPSAARRVFPRTVAGGVATLIMFAVRRALSSPERLRDLVGALRADGHLDDVDLDDADPLGFLVHPGGADSVVDAAYRFCRHTPGADVVLTGTGDVTHLEHNLASIAAGPLPAGDLERLDALFGWMDHVTAN